jgi:hypothetical protein
MKPTPRNGSTTAGACLVCGSPLPPGRPRTTCGDRCRQTLWRRLHQTPLAAPVLPARQPSKPHTVYQCEHCGTRALGDQQCDCGKFMRRAGIGGLCPCCDQPITLNELLQP